MSYGDLRVDKEKHSIYKGEIELSFPKKNSNCFHYFAVNLVKYLLENLL